MIKLVYCIVPRADLSAEEFYRTWLLDHAPLVKSAAEALHAVRYVQSHEVHADLNALLQSSRGGMQPAYDVITEIWWNSHADLENALFSEAGRAASAHVLTSSRRFRGCIRGLFYLLGYPNLFHYRILVSSYFYTWSQTGVTMDGIHDLGGMTGFGSFEIEDNEPTFHEPWEEVAFLTNIASIAMLGAYNADEYRHSIERMSIDKYIPARYYERTLIGINTLLVERGLLNRVDLDRRAGASVRVSQLAVANIDDGRP